MFSHIIDKIVNTIPAGMYCTSMYTSIKTSTFRTGLNTGLPGHVSAIPVNFEQYRPVLGVPIGTENFFFYFLSFVIFEFLLWQNDNLFALTY